jgi:hypothetical protein
MEEGQPNRNGETMGGRYQITATLGGGAMASVYRGTDLRNNTEVAIKILKNEVKDRSSFRDRFEREVLITSKVNHPRCIHKLDFGMRDDGLPYQVMELVPGRSLADLLDEMESLPPPRALRILEQLLSALSACAAAGIIHRDVKPENILIYDKDGEKDCLKLIDFGIAKLIGEAAEGHEKLTSVGMILGTPHYISPEWVTSDDVDPRADLYSATVLTFEMLTSAPPFLSEDRRELMKKHLREQPPTLKERAPHLDFSPALEAMVAKGLQKDPNNRFKDAEEYLAVLRELNQPSAPAAAIGQAAAAVLNQLPDQQPSHQSGELDPLTPVLALHRPHTMPGATRKGRGLSPLLIGGGVGLAGCLLVTLAMLDGGDGDAKPAGGEEHDAGVVAQVVVDAAPVVMAPDAEPPVVVVPMTDEQLEPALEAFRKADLEPTDFAGTLDDSKANGACRFGEVESIRALLCVSEFDPNKSRKTIRRKLPGESKARKWRSRIRRGDIQLRVEEVRKKEKKVRRKIESAFKKIGK